jgi:NAD(P)H-hydrate epimerase
MISSPTAFPTVSRQELPALSTAQMVEVDRLMIEDYGILLIQMMENAGRNLADLAQAMLGGDVLDRPILTLAGRGNNGGGGLVAARHLANRGADVQVMLARSMEDFGGVPAHQLEILLAMGVSVTTAGDGWELPSADLILDALIGYGLNGNPSGAAAGLIQLANSHPAAILSLDAPSGLDAGGGRVYDPSIRAAATLTLALPKAGLYAAPAMTGDLFVADISVPPALYEELGLDLPPLFADSPILRVI